MKKIVIMSSLSLLVLIIFALVQLQNLNDNKLHIVFCDVGQGDAILVKTPKNSFMLFDSGPDDKVIGCLGRHMPFWDRHLSLGLLTHPHADHLNGFIPVLQSYSVDQFITERLANKTTGYKKVMARLHSEGVPEVMALYGDTLSTETIKLTFVGPTDTYLKDTSPRGFIGETGEFGSLETLLTYGKFSLLMTGDSQAEELFQAESLIDNRLSVLQVPHHGSKTGLTKDILQDLHPQLAIISVGAHNKYGHPAKSTLDLLQEQKIRILRTDQSGDIEIVSNGESWELVSQ